MMKITQENADRGHPVERVDFNAITGANADGRYDWHDLPLYAERVAMAEAFLGRNHAAPGDSVLFLGCGAGHTLRAIAEHGLPVSGVDISEVAISWAKEKTDQSGLTADLRVGDVATLESYSDASFRFVLDDYPSSVSSGRRERPASRTSSACFSPVAPSTSGPIVHVICPPPARSRMISITDPDACSAMESLTLT